MSSAPNVRRRQVASIRLGSEIIRVSVEGTQWPGSTAQPRVIIDDARGGQVTLPALSACLRKLCRAIIIAATESP